VLDREYSNNVLVFGRERLATGDDCDEKYTY